MDNYMDYVKYGDILIRYPSLNYKENYILKCTECNQYYSVLENFLEHVIEHENVTTDIKTLDPSDHDPLTQSSCLNTLKVEIDDRSIEEERFEAEENCSGSENGSSESNIDNREHKLESLKNEEIFAEGSNLEESKSISFKCDECGAIVKTRKSLTRHKKIHLRENEEHQCHCCEKVFKTLNALNKHLKTHKDNEVDDESKSGDDSNDSEWEPSHRATRTCKDENNEEINTENTKESRPIIVIREGFDYNIDNHSEKPFICAQCGSRLKTRKSLKRHLRIHTRQPAEKIQETKTSVKYECEICKKVFQQSSSLKDHLRTHTGDAPYLCSECGKSFKSLSNMKQHLLRHGTNRPYECPDCPKRFPCLSDLASHKAVHSKNKAHVCDICGSGFVKPYLLKKHKMYHNGEKNHKCDYCEMRFVLADHCRRHMRTHTGEKPYRCKYCDRGFAQSNDLIKHLRSHLGDNVYKCDLCPQGFRLQGDLRTHFNTHKYDSDETKARNLQALKEEELRLQVKFGLGQQKTDTP